VTALGEQPPDKRDALPLAALHQQLDTADAALKQVEALRGELRAAVTARNVALKRLREAVARTAIGYRGMVEGDAAAMLAGGLQVAAAKSPVGRPPAPESLVAETAAGEGAVRLNWKRPVRRATFIVQAARSPGAGATGSRWPSCCGRAVR
ncbi:MAG: hypothetical protein HZA89_03290, partial [Verrucomicrobia bacterium]|nr:hypothetical protein [Verrucomicrobiota bacterium]